MSGAAGRRRTWVFVSVSLLGILGPGCGQGQGEPRIAASASAESVEAGESLRIAVVVQNFTLDGAAMGRDPEVGVGHYHVYLDEMTSEAMLGASGDSEIVVTIPEDTAPGSYTLHVTLAGNDHEWVGADCALIPLQVTAPTN
jgi:hypothetical protein